MDVTLDSRGCAPDTNVILSGQQESAAERHVAFITGAGSGIGAVTAVALGRLGARVVLADLDAERAEAAAERVRDVGGTAIAVGADVRVWEEVERAARAAIERFGRVDVLLANAGVADQSSTADGDPRRWQNVVETNLLGTIYAVRAVLPGMLVRGSGHIFVMSSVSGREAYAGESVYIASKWGQVGFAHSLRQEVAEGGIRVTLIEPGLVETPLTRDNPRVRPLLEQVEPLGAEDVARAVLFALAQPPHVAVSELRCDRCGRERPHSTCSDQPPLTSAPPAVDDLSSCHDTSRRNGRGPYRSRGDQGGLTMSKTPHSGDLDETTVEGLGGAVDRRSVLLGAAAVAGAVTFGSTRSALGALGRLAGNDKSIAFAQPDTSASVYPLLLKGAKSEASKRGYELLESHANHQLDNQINEINTWIGQKIGGMIVLPLDNNAMGPLIRKAHKNGVKFLDYSDKALPGTDGWVIFNNLQGAALVGADAGRWVNRTLGGKAKVALLTHEIQKTGRDRIHGGLAALKKVAPRVQVVARQEGVLAAECLKVTQSILQANPDVNVILCIADDGALGAERAFMQTHPSAVRQRQMYIGGWDGAIPAMKKVLAGSVIRSTGALDLVGIGAASVRATANAIEGKGSTRINYPYVLVSQSAAGKKTGRKLLAKYGA